MSRNIKFRAWDKSINEMLTQPLDGISAASRLLGFTVFSQCEVMQFTGFKDIEGKDIYEGDILDEKYKVTVEWCDGSFEVESNGTILLLKKWLRARIKAGCPSSIIGNVHENPELLEN